jgi:hypothetical protein
LRPSGVQPRPIPKPPYKNPILPRILPSPYQQPPSPSTLTRTAAGISIAWKGGNVIANRYKIKEIEQAKKSCKESVSIGTNHAPEILSESDCTKPVYPLRERVAMSLSARMSQGMICPLHSKFINRGMPLPPQLKEVTRPPREPSLSWSTDTTTNRAHGIGSVKQHPTARVTLPAQAREEMVEEQRSSRKCSAANQSQKTRGMTIKSTQSTTFEHVKRKPKNQKVLWGEPILVRYIVDPISSYSLGINEVERRLRTRNIGWCKVASETQESDSTPDEYQSIDPLAQADQFRSDN